MGFSRGPVVGVRLRDGELDLVDGETRILGPSEQGLRPRRWLKRSPARKSQKDTACALAEATQGAEVNAEEGDFAAEESAAEESPAQEPAAEDLSETEAPSDSGDSEAAEESEDASGDEEESFVP